MGEMRKGPRRVTVCGKIGSIFRAVCMKSIEAACSRLLGKRPQSCCLAPDRGLLASLFLPIVAAPSARRQSRTVQWLSGDMCGYLGTAEGDGAFQPYDDAGTQVPVLVL